MERRLILRGVVSGALAGLLAFVFARILAEPEIDRAINYERARDTVQQALDTAAGLPAAAGDMDVFTRTIQADVGLGVGMVAFGAAMGALFAVAYCICAARFSNVRPRTLAFLLAGAAFVSLYLVPFLKYPPNPPAIGHEETIGARSGYYLLIVACSLLAMVSAVWLGRTLTRRVGILHAALLAGAAFIVVMGFVIALMPSLGELHVNEAVYGNHATETPQPLRNPRGDIVLPGFPADVLYRFRLYSAGAQLLLWTTIGLVFGALAERLLATARLPEPAGERLGQAVA